MKLKYIDLIGKTFGELKVIEYEGHKQRHYWKCLCSCGKERILQQEYFVGGHCVSCGCRKKRRGFRSTAFKGFGEVPLKYYNNIRRRSKGIHKFSVSIKYLWNIFLKQNRKCALSGLLISLEVFNTSEQTASLDRIDSSKGYIKGNIQWVHKNINKMKQSFDDNYFIKMCKQVAENHKN